MTVINSYIPGIPACGFAAKTANAKFMAVLTLDAMGQYAVYIGIVCLTDAECVHNPEIRESAALQVASSGLKQSYREALQYFTGLLASDYRH